MCEKGNNMTKIKKIHCNTCNHETNHELLSSHTRTENEVLEDYGGQIHPLSSETFKYSFFVCRGCDTAILEERYNFIDFTEMHNHNDGTVYSYSYFPDRKNKAPRKPREFVHIDSKLFSVYKEIIKAHNNGLGVITSIGIRALLEGICVAEGINDRKAHSLAGKIKKLQKNSSIPMEIIDGLNNLKLIGNNAAHRLSAPDKHTISLSIDLLEALLTHLYEAKFDLKRKAELVKNKYNKLTYLKTQGNRIEF